MSDYSMLDLFRQEVEAQVQTLKHCLTMLKQGNSSPHHIQPILQDARQALKTIDGLAQVVEEEGVATVAQAVQANMIAAQEGMRLHPDQIDRLQQAADWILQLSQITEAERERWLYHHSQEIAALQTVNLPVPGSAAPEDLSQPDDAAHRPTASPTASNSLQPPALPAMPDIAGDQGLPQPIADSESDSASPPPIRLLVDAQMMDLFRLEVEEQAKILNEGLLTLEAEPATTQPLEALMRAAHSIKGAARIVGLDAAVNLAHSLEDCFVAAQNRTLTLNSDLIDQLLRGVDLLQSLSQVNDADLSDWFARQDGAISSVRSLIVSMRDLPTRADPSTAAQAQHHLAERPANAAPTESTALIPAPTGELNGTSQPQSVPVTLVSTSRSIEAGQRDAGTGNSAAPRVVRVSADNLNRIMGLAGESLIEANALPAFADALMRMRSQQIDLAGKLETLEQRLLNQSSLNQLDQMLLSQVRQQEQQCRSLLSDRLADLEEFIRRTTNLSDRLYREVITSHMRPFEEGVQNFSRMVRDLARSLNKQARLEIIGKSTSVDRDILGKLEAPITHILRNAIDHGIELPADRTARGKPAEGRIRLEAAHRGGMLAITIADDGAGINTQKLRQRAIDRQLIPPDMATRLSDAELMEFLFLPGFSLSQQVTELSGRGVGLDIVKSMAQEVGGTVRVTSQPGRGTAFHFQLPLTLSVVRTLLVEVAGEPYAFPLSRIDQIVTLQPSDIYVVENRQYFTLEQQNIGLIGLYQVLDLPPPQTAPESLWVVILSDQSDPYGLIVDRCLGEKELVVRPLDPRLGKLQDISAAALMGDGSLVLILDVSDVIRSIDGLLTNGRLAKVGETRPHSSKSSGGEVKRVLVVDDSITVREMERKLLQNHGYLVDVAVDGMEGWNAIRSYPYDLVISDIDMPRMNGIELIKTIKNHSRFQSIPVIVVSYRDREDDRIQGLEAGADYYLTKNSFHDDTLIRAVTDLIGESTG